MLFYFLLLSATALAMPDKLSIADEAYRTRGIEAKARLALETYRDLYRKNPKDVGIAWRLSMALHFVGNRYEKPTTPAKKAMFEEGIEVGNQSLALKEDCAPCHFWTGINTALLGQELGAFRALFLLSTIKRHMERTIEIDPAYAYGGASRVMAVIYQKLPGILGGSNRRSRENFESAIQHAPEEPMNYLGLARLLADDFDDIPAAKQQVEKGLKVPKPAPERLEAIEAIEELKDLKRDLASRVLNHKS